MKLIATFILSLFSLVICLGQTETVSIVKSYPVTDLENFELSIENVNGDVKVTGYNGSTIEVDLEIRITQKYSGGLAQGKQDLTMGEYESGDALILTMDAPWIERQWKNGRIDGRNFHRAPRSYDYRYIFEVKVPRLLTVAASTINKGDVTIQGVSGTLKLHNVNGSIEVADAHEVAKANTVNGDITIQYAGTQSSDAVFHTVNGDIVLKMQEGWNGQASAESMNGNFFTAFEYRPLPAKLERTTERDGEATIYKIGDKNSVAIGSGDGPRLQFETLNGDIYLKRI